MTIWRNVKQLAMPEKLAEAEEFRDCFRNAELFLQIMFSVVRPVCLLHANLELKCRELKHVLGITRNIKKAHVGLSILGN